MCGDAVSGSGPFKLCFDFRLRLYVNRAALMSVCNSKALFPGCGLIHQIAGFPFGVFDSMASIAVMTSRGARFRVLISGFDSISGLRLSIASCRIASSEPVRFSVVAYAGFDFRR